MPKMKNYTWEMIQKIYEKAYSEDYRDWNDSVISKEIFKVPNKYQPALAAAFSVVKWHKGNPNIGGGPCGLCILYSTDCEACGGCPLKKKDKDCNEYGSLFDKTCNYSSMDEDYENLYNVLLEIYKEAWEKI